MLKNIFLKSLWDSKLTLLYIFITYFLVCLLIMYVVSELPLREIQFIFDRVELPKAITAFFSGPGGINITTVEGILNTDMFSIFAPLVSIGFAVYYGFSSICQEEEKRTIDIILSSQISRSSFLTQKLASMSIKVLLIVASLLMSIILNSYIFSLSLNLINVISICSYLFFIATTFGYFSVLLGILFGKSGPIYGISSTLAISSYLIFSIEPFLNNFSFIKYISIFYYYKGGDPLNQGFHSWHWVIFMLLNIFLITSCYYLWEKRDIHQ